MLPTLKRARGGAAAKVLDEFVGQEVVRSQALPRP